MKLYNHSKCVMEDAKKSKCPRCNGFGGTIYDEEGCNICGGDGILWASKSGWTRRINGRIGESEKLY